MPEFTPVQRLCAITTIRECDACRAYALRYASLNFVDLMTVAYTTRIEWGVHFEMYHQDILEIEKVPEVIYTGSCGPDCYASGRHTL